MKPVVEVQDRLLTIREVSELTGLSIAGLYHKISRKEIPVTTLGRAVWFRFQICSAALMRQRSNRRIEKDRSEKRGFCQVRALCGKEHTKQLLMDNLNLGRRRKMVDAELKGRTLVIRLELQKPQLSSSGKTFVLATTHGFNPTRVTYKGNDIYVVANTLMKLPRGR